MLVQRESNKNASNNMTSNNNYNTSVNNNNKNNYNRKQTKQTSASSLVARLSLFERLLATRGRVNQADSDNSTSLSDLAAELSDEMGTLIDLMNLMGDLPSSRDQPGDGSGRSIEDTFPTDELFELTSAAAGLLLSESENRFSSDRNNTTAPNDDGRSKSRVSSGGANPNDDKSDDFCQKSFSDLGAEDANAGALTATESQDSLVAGKFSFCQFLKLSKFYVPKNA